MGLVLSTVLATQLQGFLLYGVWRGGCYLVFFSLKSLSCEIERTFLSLTGSGSSVKYFRYQRVSPLLTFYLLKKNHHFCLSPRSHFEYTTG